MKKQYSTLAVVFSILLLTMTNLAFAGDIDRTVRPVGKPTPQIQLPEIQKGTMKNGLSVWLVEQHKLPTIAMNLVVQSGADQDPIAMPGIASMTADVIDEGTKTRNSLAIADVLEQIGASLGANASYDGSFVTLNTLSRNLDRALEIYADVITHPSFPEKDFERLRKQRLAQLKSQKDSPVSIANNAFNYLLYGSQHPYGNNSGGTETSLPEMKRDDLVNFYTKNYVPGNATLIVVGDATLADILPRLEKAFVDWQPGTAVRTPLSEPKAPEKMKVYLIDKPGAPQSEIRIGYPALSRATPDFFAVQLMNRMLGGQFTSRINLNLREKHGYTYGARSGFSFQKGAGPFSASGGFVTEKTDSSVFQLLVELNAMREKGMTDDELAYSKKGTQGGFLQNFETPAQIAGALQNILLYGLPEDYYKNYLVNIDKVTLAEVNRVADKYLHTDKMAVLIVGDLSRIQEGVSKLNLGDVQICDVNGRPAH